MTQKWSQENNSIYNGIKENKMCINLTKEVQNLCPKNYKISLKEIKI